MFTLKLRFNGFCGSKDTGRRLKHRLSQLYQPLNFDPQGSKASIKRDRSQSKSLKLMVENGIIRGASSGTFHYLPLGTKAIDKLIRLVDEDMKIIGAQKLELACLMPQTLLDATGRWSAMESELFQLKDRQNRSLCLGPTHEEAVTELLTSASKVTHKNLPLRLYQVAKKFRDEQRVKFGLLRAREFLMKDLYTFDKSVDEAKSTYEDVARAYKNIFEKLGLRTIKVRAATGHIGGNLSHEYHLLSDIGEDKFLFCPSCEEGVSEDLDNEASETCPTCESKLETGTGIEVAHSFLLGTRYSEPLKAIFVDDKGKDSYFQMGCYGLGLSRLLAAGIEVLSTEYEIRWPKRLAPYQVCIIPPKSGSKEESATAVATHIYNVLSDLFVDDVVYDDRIKMTIGERLTLARRVGYPHVIVVAKKALEPKPLFEIHDVYAGTYQFLTHADLLSHCRNICKQSFERPSLLRDYFI